MRFRYVQPTVVSIYIYLQPLLATGFSWWLSQSGGVDYTNGFGLVDCGMCYSDFCWCGLGQLAFA